MRTQDAVLLFSDRTLNFMPKRKVGALKNILSNLHSMVLRHAAMAWQECGYAQTIAGFLPCLPSNARTKVHFSGGPRMLHSVASMVQF